MALSDKNILITPNIGNTADPKIVFSGADASTAAQNITLQVLPTNNGTLSFEGSAGQLFSIQNSLSGTIFSVNDISGIPSIEVLDTGEVKLAAYNGFVSINNSTAATSTTTGALIVTGGVGIGGKLYATEIYEGTARVITSGNINSFGVSALTAGTDTAVSATTGAVKVWSTATLDSITNRTPTTKNAISITNTTLATSTSNAALKVSGGIGASNAWFNKLQVESTATFGGQAIFNSDVIFNGAATYISSTNTSYTDNLVDIHTSGTNAAALWTYSDSRDIGIRMHYYRNSTGTAAALVLANDSGYLEWYGSGAEGTGTITISSGTYGIIKTGGMRLVNTTTSNGTDTGALIVSGGVGVAGSLYAAALYDNGNRVVTTNNLGTIGVSSINAGTDTVVSGSVGDITVWNNSTLQSVVSRGFSTTQVILISNTTLSTSTTTGALQVAGGAYFGQNINQNGVLIGSTNSYSILFGKQALSANSTGDYNTAIGHQSMLKNTTGSNNTAVGLGSLGNSTTGVGNVAVGSGAAGATSGGLEYNTAIGTNALYLTTGGYNVAIGASSLYNKTTGTFNVTAGYVSGYSLKNGFGNILVGAGSAYTINSGSYNVLVGHQTGYYLTTASNNVLIGPNAGAYLTATNNTVIIGGYDGNTAPLTGSTVSNFIILSSGSGTVRLVFNDKGAIALGPAVDYGSSGYVLTSGGNGGAASWQSIGAISGNISPFSGIFTVTNTSSALSTTTGALQVYGGVGIQGALWVGTDTNINGITVGRGKSNNSTSIAVGYNALSSNLTGQNNVAIGHIALQSSTGGTNNTAVGASAGTAITTGDQNTLIGTGAGPTITSNSQNTAVGSAAMYYTNGANNTAIGRNSLFGYTTFSPGAGNVAVGLSAMHGITAGNYNVAVGYYSMRNIITLDSEASITGSGNVGVGKESLRYISTGSYNIAIGQESSKALTTGSYNISIGFQSLYTATTSTNNIAIGTTSMYWSTGSFNVAIGQNTLKFSQGNSSVAVGNNALSSINTGSNNVAIGAGAGSTITTGSYNVLIGNSAGSTITTGSNNVIIGGYTGANAPIYNTASNHVVLSDGAGNVKLTINDKGSIGIGSTADYGTAGYFLKSQGSGSPVVWEAASTIAASISPYANIFSITNATAADSTSTAALTVTGGVGINDKLIIGKGAITRTGAKASMIYNAGSVFAADGDTQSAIYVLRVLTTGPATGQLTSTGTAVTSINQIVLPNNSIYTFKGLVTAKLAASATSAGWEVTGVATRGSGVATMSIKVANINRLWADTTSLLGLNFTVTADTTNGAISFNGVSDQAAGVQVKWAAKIETMELVG